MSALVRCVSCWSMCPKVVLVPCCCHVRGSCLFKAGLTAGSGRMAEVGAHCSSLRSNSLRSSLLSLVVHCLLRCLFCVMCVARSRRRVTSRSFSTSSSRHSARRPCCRLLAASRLCKLTTCPLMRVKRHAFLQLLERRIRADGRGWCALLAIVHEVASVAMYRALLVVRAFRALSCVARS